MDVSDFAPILPPAAEVVEEPSLSAPDDWGYQCEQCSLPRVYIIPQLSSTYTRYAKVGLVTVGIIASPPTSVVATRALSFAVTSGSVLPCVNMGRDPSSSQFRLPRVE